MKTNPIVSFRSSFSHAKREDSPAGKELSEYLVHELQTRKLNVTGPDDHDGYAWDINWLEGASGVMAVVQYVGDDPEEWLIETASPAVSFWRRGRAEVARERKELVRRFCEALHDVLVGDTRIQDVRWHSKDQLYQAWSAQPTEVLKRFE